MPVRKVDLGKPFPSLDPVQLKEGLAQSLVNGFVDRDGSMLKRSGRTLFKDLTGANPVSAIYEATKNGDVLTVCNGVIKTMAPNGDLTSWTGDALTAGHPVYFDEDEDDVFCAHGGYPTKLTLSTHVADNLGGNAPSSCTHLVAIKNNLIVNDTSLVGALSYAEKSYGYELSDSWELVSAEANPDPVTGVHRLAQELYGFGSRSVESLYNDGVTPWAPTGAPALDVGGLAHTMIDVGGTFMWLSVLDGVYSVLTLQKNYGIPVSTPYDRVIQALTDHANARAWLVADQAQPFYVISWPANNFTLAYNLSNKTWSQWSYYSGGTHYCDLLNCAQYVKGWRKQLIGSRSDGKIYEITGLTDAGGAIQFEYTGPVIDWGTSEFKYPNGLFFRVKRGATAPTWSVYLRRDGETSWSSAITPQLWDADAVHWYYRISRLKRYRAYQPKIVHADTATPFTLVSMEEDFEF